MDLYSTYPRPNQEKSSEVKVAKYSVKYMRQSKSVAVLWGVFTFCAAILNIVVFISEEWVEAHDKLQKQQKLLLVMLEQYRCYLLLYLF